MATGAVYPTLEALLEAVERVKFNRGQETSSERIQQNDKDIILSLWNRGDSNVSVETFTATDGGSTIDLQREVVGTKVKIVGRLTSTPGTSNEKALIENLLPQDYLGRTWFQVEKIAMIHNANPSNGGSNGYLELDEVSTYTSGSAVTDKSLLFIPGSSIGSSRTYLTDDLQSGVSPSTSLADIVEDTTTNNYLLSSPKDLRVSGFNLAYLTYTQARVDYSSTVTAGQTNAQGIDVSFMIEGELY
jgi:hypothetical protein